MEINFPLQEVVSSLPEDIKLTIPLSASSPEWKLFLSRNGRITIRNLLCDPVVCSIKYWSDESKHTVELCLNTNRAFRLTANRGDEPDLDQLLAYVVQHGSLPTC